MRPLHLFAGFGVELEYMLVEREGLSVLPAADEVLRAVAGEHASEVEVGDLAWSNELVLHVIELKTAGPAPELEPLPARFQAAVGRIGEILAPLGGRLMPTAMHPWMDPRAETRLWPHEYSPVYEAFDRVFGCQGHGWSNLQSVHLNLPFAGDEEFGRLHAAIRLLLPILPALAASSPIVEGGVAPCLDARLDAYRSNARQVPAVTGRVIPEPAFTRRDYEIEILEPMYRAIAPHDPDGILQHEWLNARGAIARFERSAIEIRVIDAQESPVADLAVTAATVAALRALVAERWEDAARQRAWPVEPLEEVFLAAVRDGERAAIGDARYLAAFGFPEPVATAGELWAHLIETLLPHDGAGAPWRGALDLILAEGPLARRILAALGGDLSRPNLARVYGRLCDCLDRGEVFRA